MECVYQRNMLICVSLDRGWYPGPSQCHNHFEEMGDTRRRQSSRYAGRDCKYAVLQRWKTVV